VAELGFGATTSIPPLLKVIYGDGDPGPTEMLLDERFHLGPFAASQATANARHVDRRSQFLRLDSDLLETGSDSLVADWRTRTAPLDAPLPHHVGHPDVRLDLNELHGPKMETALFTRCVPCAIFGLRLLPSARDGEDEALAPAADVVADVADDLDSLRLGAGGIALDVCNAAHARLPFLAERSSSPAGAASGALWSRKAYLLPRSGAAPGGPPDGGGR